MLREPTATPAARVRARSASLGMSPSTTGGAGGRAEDALAGGKVIGQPLHGVRAAARNWQNDVVGTIQVSNSA